METNSETLKDIQLEQIALQFSQQSLMDQYLYQVCLQSGIELQEESTETEKYFIYQNTMFKFEVIEGAPRLVSKDLFWVNK